jgi:hypothetical protein
MQPSSKSILCSGWGLFLGVAGILSIVLDMAAPSVKLADGTSFPLFRGGSFTLGWLTIVGMMIAPAAALRQFRLAPINKFLAFLWCVVVFFGWVASHALFAGGDPNDPPKPNLTFVAGLVLCWRLLTRRDGQSPSESA